MTNKARIIAIGTEKGGVGKTTTVINLAAGLARQNRRVLIVDTDTQGHVATCLGLAPQYGLYDYMVDGKSMADVLVEARDNIYLIAGGESIARLAIQMSLSQIAPEQQLKNTLAPIADRFHYILLDTGPSRNVVAINVAFFAREILCPVTPEALAVDGMKSYLQWIATFQSQSGIVLKYVLPTDVDARLKQTDEIASQLRNAFGDKICESIRTNVRLSEASAHNQTIFEYAPNSRGAEDYAKLVQRVMQDE